MGYFPEFEVSADIFNPVDNDDNDTISYPVSADLTLDLHIIRYSTNEVNIAGEEIAEFEANPNGDRTSTIKKNAKVVQGSKSYLVVSEPDYKPLAGVTKMLLRLVTSG